MDLLSGATTLATIVGLLADFSAHRKDQEPSDMPAFVEWLRVHGHADLLAAIEANHATSISIKAILSSQRKELQEQLGEIEKNLAVLCDAHGAFGQLARVLRPDAMLSAQAKDILIQYEMFGASKALELHHMDGVDLMFLDGSGGNVQINEERFYTDDMERLVEFGLLRVSHNSQGQPVFHITREAAAFAQKLIP